MEPSGATTLKFFSILISFYLLMQCSVVINLQSGPLCIMIDLAWFVSLVFYFLLTGEAFCYSVCCF